ncbi:hypothetical protein G3I62_27820 [Streptomyces sp. SID14446]|uniref:hypothetical protein n=1 Tax=Streptomyces sp. SID14446 TaxID=2706072 RepID=UPI0013BDCF8F|nr:hypothetical protein [Streptomyces sp. SID14446]NEB32854.1 hypothetical protein [Streptomyces sp. SID14446]
MSDVMLCSRRGPGEEFAGIRRRLCRGLLRGWRGYLPEWSMTLPLKQLFSWSVMYSPRTGTMATSCRQTLATGVDQLKDYREARLQLLAGAGRNCSPEELVLLVTRLDEGNARWVLLTACGERPREELPEIERLFMEVRSPDAHRVAAAYREREEQANAANSTRCSNCGRTFLVSQASLIRGSVHCPWCNTLGPFYD